jgi:lipopolysaccharide biosynthesis glycosyltransferase
MKISLYTAYHKTAPRIAGDHIHPIHVGRARTGRPIPGMIGDDTGDHISAQNDTWCELTALYWAWKNDADSAMIGLMHYRRLLDLTGEMPGGATEQHPGQFDTATWAAKADDWLRSAAGDWDIILPRPHVMGQSVAQNYKVGHAEQDWTLLRDILGRDHPDYLDSFDHIAAGPQIRLANMFLMKRALFERYCSWLFGLLQKVADAPLDRSRYSVGQRRFLGFLAERLFTVFVHHEQKTNPALRVRDVSILNLSQSLVTPYLTAADAPPPETVNIALSADRAYLPHAAAMLRSVMDHADPDRPLNIFFLHSGITPYALQVLETMLSTRKNTSLHALNTAGAFDDSYRSASRAPSNATYNRFLLFSLLPGLKRLLYLDADVIVNRDICALFDTDLGGASLGAVPDWIMTRTLTGPTRTIDPDVPDLTTYQRDRLGLSDDQIARYFNAGVLLFDFEAMGEDLALQGQKMQQSARDGRYLFRDQDILNIAFKDDLHVLDARWNVFNSTAQSYRRAPVDGHATALAARKDPWLVHYADRMYKPWQQHPVPHGELYWQALIRTPFYAEVVARLSPRPSGPDAPQAGVVRAGRALAERVPVLKRPLLRLYEALKRG